jgi:hypothetical protein
MRRELRCGRIPNKSVNERDGEIADSHRGLLVDLPTASEWIRYRVRIAQTPLGIPVCGRRRDRASCAGHDVVGLGNVHRSEQRDDFRQRERRFPGRTGVDDRTLYVFLLEPEHEVCRGEAIGAQAPRTVLRQVDVVCKTDFVSLSERR